MAAEADVVAVETAVAVGGGADVALAAAVAAEKPGEQVVGLVGAARLGVVAALVHHLLCAVEGAEVDQRFVRAGVVRAAEEDLAEVDAVAQDGADGLRVERHAAPGAVAVLGEPASDRLSAVLPLGVALEDQPNDGTSSGAGTRKCPAPSRR